MNKVKHSIEERFWSKVIKTDGCWIWTGATNEHGYGILGRSGKYNGNIRAHRLSWIIHFGPIEDDIDVCHICDNPPCTNPIHLFKGDAKSNAIDMSSKHRQTTAKLTIEQVRQLRNDAGSQRYLAKKYNISQVQVWRILNKESWSWVC